MRTEVWNRAGSPKPVETASTQAVETCLSSASPSSVWVPRDRYGDLFDRHIAECQDLGALHETSRTIHVSKPGASCMRNVLPAPRDLSLRTSAARSSRKTAAGSTTQYDLGRGDSSQGDCGDQLACLSASRSRFRFRRSEVVGSVSTAEPAWRSSALPPNYVTVDHLEPVDADLFS